VAERAAVSASRWLRALLPVVVSIGLLFAISTLVDWRDVWQHVTADSLVVLLPALAAWAALSLAVDAVSLLRSGGRRAAVSLGAMARLKAASYPLAIVHYALGAAALIVLLRRRAGLLLADATGTVVLIAAFDLLALLGLALLATLWMASSAAEFRAGVVAAVLLGAPLGLWLLRSERRLGPIEWLRSLGVMRVAREAPLATLLELLALRALFVAVFVMLGGAALAAFGVRVPLGGLVLGLAQVALVAALPIAVAGLGTSQAAFLYVFRSYAAADELLACSVTLSAGMIAVRVVLGALFAGEYSRGSAPGEVET
jgi:hypothetical protein